MKLFKKQTGVHYLRLKDGHIIDCLPYHPMRGDYIRFEGELPADIMSGCYRMKDGVIIVNKTRMAAYQKQLAELEVIDNE